MAFFEWDDSMSVGVPPVDRDHRLLIDLINQLHDCLGSDQERAVVASVLDALVEYTVHHFRREETVMDACGYPRRTEHRHLHEALSRRVAEVEGRFLSQPDASLGPELLDFLRDWLIDHILERDRDIGRYARGRPECVAAAESVPRLSFGAPAAKGGAVDWRRLRVLVVDGNPTFRKVVVTILQTVEVGDVREAASAAEALAALSDVRPQVAADWRPQVIVADWRPGGADGLDFLRAVRAADPSLPVVVITGSDAGDFVAAARALGTDRFLTKPVTAKGMLLAVARAATGE